MAQSASFGRVVGREAELRRLRTAIQKRTSPLIWGPKDSGKTALIQKAIRELPESIRRRCVYWTGAASGREWVSHLVCALYLAGDAFVRRKAHADGACEATLNRWLPNQSALRLRGILFKATEQGEYWFFLDHVPPPTHKMARLMKDIMYRCKTPIYLSGLGYSPGEIGQAWSLYWTDQYRIHLGPLTETAARALFELCIHRFSLGSLDLDGFREELLRLSGHLPGAIVKMCELASGARYRHGDQIKIKLVHVDYFMRANPWNSTSMPTVPS